MGFWKSPVIQKSCQVTCLRLVTWDFCITCDFQNPILTFPTHSIFTGLKLTQGLLSQVGQSHDPDKRAIFLAEEPWTNLNSLVDPSILDLFYHAFDWSKILELLWFHPNPQSHPDNQIFCASKLVLYEISLGVFSQFLAVLSWQNFPY